MFLNCLNNENKPFFNIINLIFSSVVHFPKTFEVTSERKKSGKQKANYIFF